MKKQYKKALLLGVAIAILSGCATPRTEENYSAILDSWVGQSIKPLTNHLQEQLGEPKIYTLDNGLTAYEYNTYRVETKGGGFTPEVVQVGEQPVFHNGQMLGMQPIYRTVYHKNPVYDVEYACQTIFEVDAQDVIRHWKWKGNDCKTNNKPS